MITLPNSYNTDVLTEEQIQFLSKLLPQPHSNTGRPSYSNAELLPGILRVLRSGMRLRDLDDRSLPSSVTHWRRLRFWQRKFELEKIWNLILTKLGEDNKLNLKVGAIDGSLIQSFKFKDMTGYSGKYKKTGTKISSLVDSNGLPLNLVFAPGNRHDLPFAKDTVKRSNYKPDTLLADKGYDSDNFRFLLIKLGIIPNISPRNIKNRKLKPKYDHELGKKRYKVERTNAWIKSFRRLRFRFDYTSVSFKALVFLGLIVICIRKLI